MKKMLNLTMFILVILLSGCKRSESYSILEKIEFNQNGLYCIDKTKDVNSMLLFGVVNNFNIEEFNELDKSDVYITLVSDDNQEIIFKPENIEWQQCDSNVLKNGISMRLNFEKIDFLYPLVIKKVVFNKDKIKIEKKIQNTYIDICSSEKNGISVMEAPISPKNEIVINEKYSFAYKILDAKGIITEDLKAEVSYDREFYKYIDINSVTILRDEESENQIKEDYKNIITEEELEKIKVYDLRCEYMIKKKSNIIFQPKIIIQFSTIKQELSPFEPIFFFNSDE